MKKTSKSRSRRRRLLRRRLLALSLLVVVIGLASFLFWKLIEGVSDAIATGDQPVSSTVDTTVTTTTTTHPTIAANAQVSAPRIMVYDLTHSAVLYGQNAEEKCYPASLTKLLTAIIATEECAADEVFTVGSELSLLMPNSSTAGLQAGYKLTRDMIIDALLIKSGNDAAYTIAAHVGRKIIKDQSATDIEALFAFSDKMNQKAAELGAINSHFSNPDGYFAEDHYTTASDMLKIAVAARKYENIRQSTAKLSASHTLLSGQQLTFKTTNKLLIPNNPYYFPDATGMKTGFTDEAGYCFVASARRDGVEVIVVIMGDISSERRWRDAIALFNDAFAVHQTATAAPAA